MIEKKSVLITSLGRTGTKFFQEMMSSINPEYTALHEPDYINFGQYDDWGTRVAQLKNKISDSGIGNLFYWNLILQMSLVELSDQRIRKIITHDDAVDELIKRRGHFIKSQPGEIYIESSSANGLGVDLVFNEIARLSAKHIKTVNDANQPSV